MPEGTSGGFQPGLTSGTNPAYDIPGAAKLGAKVECVDFNLTASVQSMEPGSWPTMPPRAPRSSSWPDFLRIHGPTPAEADNLATWAKTFGPGGTFWAQQHRWATSRQDRSSLATRQATATSTPTTRPAGYASRAQNICAALQGSRDRNPRRLIPASGLLRRAIRECGPDLGRKYVQSGP